MREDLKRRDADQDGKSRIVKPTPPPERGSAEAVLAMQRSAGNAATARLLGGGSPSAVVARESADPVRDMHAANARAMLESGLQQMEFVRSLLLAVLPTFVKPETIGAAMSLRSQCVGILTQCERMLEQAANAIVDMRAHTPASSHVESIQRDLLDRPLAEMRAKLPLWRLRIETLSPIDPGGAIQVGTDLSTAIAMLRGGMGAGGLGTVKPMPSAASPAAPSKADAPIAGGPAPTPPASAPVAPGPAPQAGGSSSPAAPVAPAAPVVPAEPKRPPWLAAEDEPLLAQVDQFIALNHNPVLRVWAEEEIDPDDNIGFGERWLKAARIVEWRAQEARAAGDRELAAKLERAAAWNPPSEDPGDQSARAQIVRFLREKGGEASLEEIVAGVGMYPGAVESHLNALSRPKGRIPSNAPPVVSPRGGNRWSARPRRPPQPVAD